MIFGSGSPSGAATRMFEGFRSAVRDAFEVRKWAIHHRQGLAFDFEPRHD